VYAKSGCIADAQKVFDKLTAQNNVVLWTAMIAGYTQKGCIDEALKLFLLMQRAGVKPNQFTYPTVLRACANLASMEVGKQVHCHIIKTGAASDTFVASTIVDMYIKCGSLADGQRGFDRIPRRDIVSWNTMIAGYAQHGYVDQALEIFEQMQQCGMKPNHVTFVAVLCACSHGGLVGLGLRYFDSLSRTHSIIPRMEHYACIVDLLGRVGRLYEAEHFINNMPFEPSALVWETLLQACRIHGNMEVGKRAEMALACGN
jgi:pentatricopeptide repeat protein